MSVRSEHISVGIECSAQKVYDYAADPRNLPAWASGLAGATVEQAEGQWFTDSPMGRVTFEFAPRNEFGVLDHDVTLPAGETVHNPMRVMSDGDACEVVFTLRQRPGMTDEELMQDADAVAKDLGRLKTILERP